MLCYRIVKPAHAASALSGEGARVFGGRWNPPGRACVYTAESRALAVLEMLVHLTGRSRALPYRLLTVEVPDDSLVGTLQLPAGWGATPGGRASQGLGEDWLRSGEAVALRVPSVIIPEEFNLLLNPLAPGYERVRVLDERDFQLDLRLAAAD